MSNEENLIPLNHRTKEEQRKIQSAGGKARAKKARERRAMREVAESVLSMPMEKGKLKSVDDIKNYLDTKDKNLTVQEIIILKQIEKAIEGDLKSAEFLRDLVGEKPTSEW